MSQRVAILAVYKRHQWAGGAYSFQENLLRGLAELRTSQPPAERLDVTVFIGSDGIPWTDEQFAFRRIRDRGGRWPVETRVGMWDSRGYDGVLFPNTFTPPVVAARRAVTVIHDLQYLNLPEYWPLAKRIWMRTCHEVTLRRCDTVVAISEWVKGDILKHYGERWESRIRVISNPISFERLNQPADQDFSRGRPYLLCTGVDRPPKNFATLIRAFAKFRERSPEYCLVLAGQLRKDDRAWQRRDASVTEKLPSAGDLVEALGLTNHVVITGYIPDAQLGALYRGASLFVLPSLFEGFGMPAVEALVMGTPTLISDLPVLREVTNGGAHYIADPKNHEQMADEIRQVLAMGDAARPSIRLRDELRQQFAPLTIARQYASALLGNNP